MVCVRFDFVKDVREILEPLMNLSHTANILFDRDQNSQYLVLQVGDHRRVFAAVQLDLFELGVDHVPPEQIQAPFTIHLPTFDRYLSQYEERMLLVDFLFDARQIHLTFKRRAPHEDPRSFAMMMCEDQYPHPRLIDNIAEYIRGFNHAITLPGRAFMDTLYALNPFDKEALVSITELGVQFATTHTFLVLTRDRWENARGDQMPHSFIINLDELDGVYWNAFLIAPTVHLLQRTHPEPHLHTVVGYHTGFAEGELFIFCPIGEVNFKTTYKAFPLVLTQHLPTTVTPDKLLTPHKLELRGDRDDAELKEIERLSRKKKKKKKLVWESGNSGLKGSSTSSDIVASCSIPSPIAVSGKSSTNQFLKDDGCLSGLKYIVANPRLVRLSSIESLKQRNYENHYPKDKKEIPKANGEKSESKEKSNTEDQGGFQGTFSKNAQNMLTYTTDDSFVLPSLFSFDIREQKQISFQEFNHKLFEPGHTDVSYKSVVKVYAKSSAQSPTCIGAVHGSVSANPAGRNTGQYEYYFNIGSAVSFEKLEEEVDSRDFISITYVSEVVWYQELMIFAPSVSLLGTLWFTGQKVQGGLGGIGGGGKGDRGTGKATVTKVDNFFKNKVYFKNVTGCDEAILEIKEFVHFLKKPEMYEDLGAKIPNVIAGESRVPFMTISCSDFMEMFVAVGPSRVRNLFQEARQCASSIIFINEIDAIGRARGRGGFSLSNIEHEGTLDQLLVEMNEFGNTAGVVVLAGTNRLDILDKALPIPGRFDRQITIDKPDINGRNQIFQIDLKNFRLDQAPSYYSQRLAALTSEFAGADIDDVCNEAALIVARNEETLITMDNFETAIDQTTGCHEKKNKIMSLEAAGLASMLLHFMPNLHPSASLESMHHFYNVSGDTADLSSLVCAIILAGNQLYHQRIDSGMVYRLDKSGVSF